MISPIPYYWFSSVPFIVCFVVCRRTVQWIRLGSYQGRKKNATYNLTPDFKGNKERIPSQQCIARRETISSLILLSLILSNQFVNPHSHLLQISRAYVPTSSAELEKSWQAGINHILFAYLYDKPTHIQTRVAEISFGCLLGHHLINLLALGVKWCETRTSHADWME